METAPQQAFSKQRQTDHQDDIVTGHAKLLIELLEDKFDELTKEQHGTNGTGYRKRKADA